MTKTKQEYIEIIRKRCIEANPDIMEWRCENCNKKYGEYINGCVFCWRNELSREENIKLFPKRGVRQIGRKIGIAEVLVAIQEFHKGGLIYRVSIEDILTVDMVGDNKEYKTLWNLKMDNIKNQDLPTLKSAADLLSNPKDI